MASHSNELVDSFHRCNRDGEFLDTFYECFLSKSPAIAPMFAQTDFKLQKLMLRQSLLEMIGFDRGLSGTQEEIERLGHRHKELGVTPEMYTMWLDALCDAIREHDPEYSVELEQHWRKAMRSPISKMIAIGVGEGE